MRIFILRRFLLPFYNLRLGGLGKPCSSRDCPGETSLGNECRCKAQRGNTAANEKRVHFRSAMSTARKSGNSLLSKLNKICRTCRDSEALPKEVEISSRVDLRTNIIGSVLADGWKRNRGHPLGIFCSGQPPPRRHARASSARIATPFPRPPPIVSSYPRTSHPDTFERARPFLLDATIEAGLSP